MRKLLALSLAAMLALGMMSIAGCGGAGDEATMTDEVPVETPPMDDMMADSTAADAETDESGH